jgi:hypothetical protein
MKIESVEEKIARIMKSEIPLNEKIRRVEEIQNTEKQRLENIEFLRKTGEIQEKLLADQRKKLLVSYAILGNMMRERYDKDNSL